MTWDYKVLYRKGVDSRLQNELDEFGEAGWELVAVTPPGKDGTGHMWVAYIFKRRKT